MANVELSGFITCFRPYGFAEEPDEPGTARVLEPEQLRACEDRERAAAEAAQSLAARRIHGRLADAYAKRRPAGARK